MPHPLVSILVPVYNVEPYIERCVRSVFEQTYDNLEYVFVDDCTPDKSIEILERIMQEYPQRAKHVRIIHHKDNCGNAARARKTAVAHCQGEFLCHVDSDDWMERNAVELLVTRQQATGADIVSGRHLIHYVQGVVKERNAGQGLDKMSLLRQLMCHKETSVIWGRLIRHSLYTDHHIAPDSRGGYAEDIQVLPQLVWYAQKIATIDDVIHHYNRENESAMTTALPTNLRLQQEYMFSQRLVSAFFADKDSECRRISDETVVRYSYHFMKEWIRRGDKTSFDALRDVIVDKRYRYCWHVVGWDNGLRRFVNSHYSLRRLRYLLHI